MFTPVPGGVRWDSSSEAEICFGADGVGAAKLEIAKGPCIVASDLVILWTDGLRLEPQQPVTSRSVTGRSRPLNQRGPADMSRYQGNGLRAVVRR